MYICPFVLCNLPFFAQVCKNHSRPAKGQKYPALWAVQKRQAREALYLHRFRRHTRQQKCLNKRIQRRLIVNFHSLVSKLVRTFSTARFLIPLWFFGQNFDLMHNAHADINFLCVFVRTKLSISALPGCRKSLPARCRKASHLSGLPIQFPDDPHHFFIYIIPNAGCRKARRLRPAPVRIKGPAA